jgi:hypothetical protein
MSSRGQSAVLVVSADLVPFSPSIRLRIGVSGHRLPPKLPTEAEAPLRARLDRILATIIDAARSQEGEFPWSHADNARSEFVLVSSLAEGADRLVAEAGLAAGYSLEAVLPFARAEYSIDFATPDSRSTFEQLLGRASAVFELDGVAEERVRAYQAAGFIMLSNVDLLIAIWDGDEAAGVGGTAQIVSRAIADGIPVIRLDPHRPDVMEIAWPQADDLPPPHGYTQPAHVLRSADDASLGLVVKDLLAAPDGVAGALSQYLAEEERRWSFCPWYPLLLLIFAGRLPTAADFRLPPALPDTQAKWAKYFSSMPSDRAQRPAIESALLPAFSAADHLSVFYSLVYRSTFVFNFLFAAIAVALALAGIFVHDADVKVYLVAAELVIIFTILVTWSLGRHRQWHRRWLEYRRLAECLRQVRILAPLGGEGPISRFGADVDGHDWVDWYVWSLRRLVPIPDVVVSQAYIGALTAAVRSGEIADQVVYHAANAQRLALVERRMHSFGQLLFGLTGSLCAIFVVLYFLHVLPNHDSPYYDLVLGLFTFVTALLPTFGAALGAIDAQGDFKTRSEQSARTAARLNLIDQALAQERLDFARLADRVQKTSDIMMADLEEWQTVFRTRPLSLPA